MGEMEIGGGGRWEEIGGEGERGKMGKSSLNPLNPLQNPLPNFPPSVKSVTESVAELPLP